MRGGFMLPRGDSRISRSAASQAKNCWSPRIGCSPWRGALLGNIREECLDVSSPDVGNGGRAALFPQVVGGWGTAYP
jgi:hypothetical protein